MSEGIRPEGNVSTWNLIEYRQPSTAGPGSINIPGHLVGLEEVSQINFQLEEGEEFSQLNRDGIRDAIDAGQLDRAYGESVLAKMEEGARLTTIKDLETGQYIPLQQHPRLLQHIEDIKSR